MFKVAGSKLKITAYHGFVSAADRKRVDAFLRRSKRCGFCPTDLSTFDDLLGQSDTRLFSKIVANDQHVLHQLRPPQTTASQNYSLRERPHPSFSSLSNLPAYLTQTLSIECYIKTYTNFLLINDPTCYIAFIVHRHWSIFIPFLLCTSNRKKLSYRRDYAGWHHYAVSSCFAPFATRYSGLLVCC